MAAHSKARARHHGKHKGVKLTGQIKQQAKGWLEIWVRHFGGDRGGVEGHGHPGSLPRVALPMNMRMRGEWPQGGPTLQGVHPTHWQRLVQDHDL